MGFGSFYPVWGGGRFAADETLITLHSPSGHAFAAGYDIRTAATYAATISSFDEIVGLKYLKGMHLNDSQGGGLGCRKDRHENIGL